MKVKGIIYSNQMWCTKSNVNFVQQKSKPSMWVKQPGIYTPVAENTRGTMEHESFMYRHEQDHHFGAEAE